MKRVMRPLLCGVAFAVSGGVAVVARTPNETAAQASGQQGVSATLELIEPAHAAPTCGPGGFACGDLEKNGTCCRTDDSKCCYVPPDRGSCYCVLKGDKCDRY